MILFRPFPKVTKQESAKGGTCSRADKDKGSHWHEPYSEIAIQKALVQIMKDRTTFIIAHRLSTIRKADKIIVLENGRILEIGTHEDLLDSQGLYRKFHELQYCILDI